MSADSPAPAPAGATPDPDNRIAEMLGSVHTTNFPDLLRQLGGCLVISTYQAGKLVILRPDGATINTHYRSFNRPMGMAADAERLALGTALEIAEFRNMPAVAKRMQDPPRHDAVYMARRVHITGAIDIHEMAWDKHGDLWFVNTLFSCLCTLDAKSSFVPRWRPRFVRHYAPEDRCHLNGLAMRDGKPRYLTALGECDEPQGWRNNKRDGGIVIDLVGDKVIARGLSMPHSPRWHAGKLWVLESGRGKLVTIDPATGAKTDVASVPGFARGLDFLGPVAFIGLSQLRETNAFTDIEITDDNRDRQSGVWVVHLDTGNTIALLKFTGGVQEIFAVQAIPGVLFPEIISDGEYLTNSYALPDEALREVGFTPQPTPATPGAGYGNGADGSGAG
ncbi:MAG: TIGR03032 family protein [Dokdonella sp.]|uniref:TIGR03032 family protein n=1 Tax=Dokdonella sp. TaxID=2291710 RepID=UPI0025C5F750|nr:TIGR03032 family protein [Dokdonella sp.]MBX3699429.1 TIGR03032 family protein [Dokdonella sp.]